MNERPGDYYLSERVRFTVTDGPAPAGQPGVQFEICEAWAFHREAGRVVLTLEELMTAFAHLEQLLSVGELEWVTNRLRRRGLVRGDGAT